MRTATAGDTEHGRQLFDGIGSNGLYLHVTRIGSGSRDAPILEAREKGIIYLSHIAG